VDGAAAPAWRLHRRTDAFAPTNKGACPLDLGRDLLAQLASADIHKIQ
jgi:hypothetical protein